MLEHGLAVQLHLALHPIWMYQIKRTEQPVKERSYP
jgi:hypothetical protein